MNSIPHNMHKGKIVGRKDWTKKLFSLYINTNKIIYTAGQFTKLGLETESSGLVRRAYSIVTHPENANHLENSTHLESSHNNILEFLIVMDEQGELTPKLHQLQIGDDLLVGDSASGFMTLDQIPDSSSELWLLATGSAIGPFIAMLMDKQVQKRFEKVVLVHAVRFKNELIYQDQITTFLNSNERVRYVPVVSRESVPGVLSGRIPNLLLNGELEKRAETLLDTNKSFIYLCGNPAMVKDASNALNQLGLVKHLKKSAGNFTSENYW